MKNIPNTYRVQSIEHSECKEWCLDKHYAKRMPPISYSFGLFDKNNVLIGICTYGRPMAHPLIKNAFGGLFQDCFYELNRLVLMMDYQRIHSHTLCLKRLKCYQSQW